ncbi:MAG: hypothetical protein ACKV2V_14770, partial [Blastocatellia bacterium]
MSTIVLLQTIDVTARAAMIPRSHLLSGECHALSACAGTMGATRPVFVTQSHILFPVPAVVVTWHRIFAQAHKIRIRRRRVLVCITRNKRHGLEASGRLPLYCPPMLQS